MKELQSALTVVLLAAAPIFAQSATSARPSTSSAVSSRKIDLNSASQSELEQLPGVGPATAKKIIAGRPYTNVADLERSGVAARTISEIGPLVTAKRLPTRSDPRAPNHQPSRAPSDSGTIPASGRKIDLNTASQAELEQLPRIGTANAKKIIAGRPYRTVADLAQAGIPASTINQIAPLVSVVRHPDANSTRPNADRTQPTLPAPERASPIPQQKPSPVEPSPVPTAGMVWVNTDTKIYHREGDRWYGKTNHGRYMNEQDAIREGNRAAKK